MREKVGTCHGCACDVYCTDGFLNGVVEENRIYCFPCWHHHELIRLLNQLLEAEKAGVETLAYLLYVTPNEPLFEQIKEDEAWSCRGLIACIKREKGEISTKTGDFAEKVKALPTRKEQLALLNKGQAWVARKIDEALKLEMHPETKQFLLEMKQKHVDNIAQCEQMI